MTLSSSCLFFPNLPQIFSSDLFFKLFLNFPLLFGLNFCLLGVNNPLIVINFLVREDLNHFLRELAFLIAQLIIPVEHMLGGKLPESFSLQLLDMSVIDIHRVQI